MANKQNFKPDEWTKILESTMLAGMAVSAAEPSGLVRSRRRSPAVQRWLRRSRTPGPTNSLRPLSRSLRQRREDQPFRKHCVSTLPAPLSLLTLFSVHSLAYKSAMLRRPLSLTYQRPLERGPESIHTPSGEPCDLAGLSARRPHRRAEAVAPLGFELIHRP